MKQHKPFTVAALRHAADHLEKRVGVHLAKASEARTDGLDERSKAWRKSAHTMMADARRYRERADKIEIEGLM